MRKEAKKKILILVEGQNTEPELLQKLFTFYPELDVKYEVVSYCTHIYALYQSLFADDRASEMDLLQVLKEREKDDKQKIILDQKYTDILLFFDFDAHDSQFTEEKIKKMLAYFCESSDMGQLYINYPMVESFYHLKDIPDIEFQDKIIEVQALRDGKYKEIVHKESFRRFHKKYPASRKLYSCIIRHHIEKALHICASKPLLVNQEKLDANMILDVQLDAMKNGYINVLCTCVWFIYEYNEVLRNQVMQR